MKTSPRERPARLSLTQRLAWRDMMTNKRASALVLALIVLPLLLISAWSVWNASANGSVDHRVQASMGQAIASVRPMLAKGRSLDVACTQLPDAPSCREGTQRAKVEGAPAELASSQGLRWVPENSAEGSLDCQIKGGDMIGGRLVQTDAADPVNSGKYRLIEGAWPRTGDEVVLGVTTCPALRLGDTVTWKGSKQLKVVGIATGKALTSGSLVSPTFDLGKDVEHSGLLAGQGTLSDQAVSAWNDRGYFVESRAMAEQSKSSGSFAVGPEALMGLLVTVEVALIAGAAFAMGVRRQRRHLGLLSTVGADAQQLRGVVLWRGVWLGVLGSATGVVLGAVIGTITTLIIQHWLPRADVAKRIDLASGSLQLPWGTLFCLFLLGAVGSLVAALLPAQEAAKGDAMSALKSADAASPRPRFPRRVLLLLALTVSGLALILTGIATADGGPGSIWSALWVTPVQAALVIAIIIEVILLLPWLLWRFNDVRSGPLAFRLAGRGIARHLGRSVPTVAGVILMSAIAGALFTGQAYEQAIADEYVTQQPPAHMVSAVGVTSANRGDVERTLREVTGANVVDRATYRQLQGTIETAETRRCKENFSRACLGSFIDSTLAVGPDAWKALVGRPPTAAEAASLASGSALVVRRHQSALIEQGHIEIRLGTELKKIPAVALENAPAALRSIVIVPETYLAQWKATEELPSMRSNSKGGVAPGGIFYTVQDWFWLSQSVTYDQASQLRHSHWYASSDSHVGFSPVQLSDPRSAMTRWWGLGLIALLTLIITGVTVALTAIDSGADDNTLAATGADPGLRRRIMAWTMGIYCLVGTLVGTLLSVVTLVAIIASGLFGQERPVVIPAVPWLMYVVMVPLAGAVLAMVLTRSKVSMVRRLD